MGKAENSVWNVIEELSNKQGITEIMINGPEAVFVERGGQFIQLNASLSKIHMYEFINDIADFNNKKCNKEIPIMDGMMPDGSRINIIMEPFSLKFPAITIRKYLNIVRDSDLLGGFFGLDEKWAKFLGALVSSKMNIIVSGGTGVGKTTLMNLLINKIDASQRVITVEDTAELNVKLPNVVSMESGVKGIGTGIEITTGNLVKNALRMRPDRLIIGEVRGGELFDLLQAMNTGHEGSISSVHANSPGEALLRMETLYLLSGHDVSYRVIRRQISSAIDFIIQLSKNRSGERVVTEIMEITGMNDDNILTQQVAISDDGTLNHTGIAPKNMARIHEFGGIPIDFL